MFWILVLQESLRDADLAKSMWPGAPGPALRSRAQVHPGPSEAAATILSLADRGERAAGGAQPTGEVERPLKATREPRHNLLCEGVSPALASRLRSLRTRRPPGSRGHPNLRTGPRPGMWPHLEASAWMWSGP